MSIRMTVNGQVINVEGNRISNVSMINDKIIIGGQTVISNLSGNVHVTWEGGTIENLTSDGSITCNDVAGNVSALGSVTCNDVIGSVCAGGSIVAKGYLKGSISAGGSVKIGC